MLGFALGVDSQSDSQDTYALLFPACYFSPYIVISSFGNRNGSAGAQKVTLLEELTLSTIVLVGFTASRLVPLAQPEVGLH